MTKPGYLKSFVEPRIVRSREETELKLMELADTPNDRQSIRRGVFRSIVDLQSAINAYLAEHNAHPKPFVWTQSAKAILAKLDRLLVLSECV
jgi:hypothetical protein